MCVCDWKTMDSAPRDGTRILLAARFSDPTVMLGQWRAADPKDPEDVPGWDTDMEWWPESDFTHWAPLPAIPARG